MIQCLMQVFKSTEKSILFQLYICFISEITCHLWCPILLILRLPRTYSSEMKFYDTTKPLPKKMGNQGVIRRKVIHIIKWLFQNILLTFHILQKILVTFSKLSTLKIHLHTLFFYSDQSMLSTTPACR